MRYTPEYVDRYFAKHKIEDMPSESYVFDDVEIVVKGSKVNKSLFVKYVAKLLKIIHELTPTRRNRITIVYYASLRKKQLPTKQGTMLTPEHVNSGYSFPYSGEKDVNIVIYRREEFFKVLTHEMLHYYHVVPHDEVFNSQLKSTYPFLSDTIEINEAMVELNAMLINLRIIADLKNASQDERKRMLIYELLWTKEKVEELYRHFNISPCRHTDMSKWKETDTHAFSYFFLKYLLLQAITPKIPFLKNKSLRMTINDIENIKLT